MATKKLNAKPNRPRDAVGADVHGSKVITEEIEEEPTTRLIVDVVPDPPEKKKAHA